MKVYVATQGRTDGDFHRRKIIGIFSSKANAFTVVDAIAGKSEPFDYPDFFQVDVYDLDQEFFDKVGGRVMTGTST